MLAAVAGIAYSADGDPGKLALTILSAGFGMLFLSGAIHAWHRPPPRIEVIPETNAVLLPYSGWSLPRLSLIASFGLIGAFLPGIGLYEKDLMPILLGIYSLAIAGYLAYRITSDRFESYMAFTDDYLRVVMKDAAWEIEWQFIESIYGVATSPKGDVYLRCAPEKTRWLKGDPRSAGGLPRYDFWNESVQKISAYDWNCHPNSLLSTFVYISGKQSTTPLPTYDEMVRMLDCPGISTRKRIDRSRIL